MIFSIIKKSCRAKKYFFFLIPFQYLKSIFNYKYFDSYAQVCNVMSWGYPLYIFRFDYMWSWVTRYSFGYGIRQYSVDLRIDVLTSIRLLSVAKIHKMIFYYFYLLKRCPLLKLSCSMLASNLSTWELEVICKICGSNCCVDFNQ